MQKFEKHYSISAPIAEVWKALTDPKVIEKWGAGPNPIMSDTALEDFSLWDGSIYGKNLEVEHERYLKQEWYGGDWDEPSIVTFTLVPQGDMTSVTLLHENLPDKEADSFEKGWDSDYMGPLKDFVEN